jgi:hypothetical protein
MPDIDRDHLEALRLQMEEEYRLDIAAIERLQRRFLRPLSSTPSSNYSSPSNGSNDEPRNTVLSPQSAPLKPQSDRLVDSLWSVFAESNGSRK